MPKKKGHNKQVPKDVTLDYYANAQKPASKPKKFTPVDPQVEIQPDTSWDQIPDDEDINIVTKTNPDGSTNFICTSNKKQNNCNVSNSDSNFNDYPEILWHEISRRIDPEDIGRFALINKITYGITQQKSFWVDIYERHCKHSPYLPARLKIEDWAKTYGLKTRIIKALYHTNDFFLQKVLESSVHDSKPHELVKRRCVNMWFRKTRTNWTLYFKLKKLPHQYMKKLDYDFMEELGRLDANPELDNQILQVHCEYFNEVPPLMGMTLTSVKLGLSKNFRSHKLVMGFNSASHVDRNILPECTITLDKVNTVVVYDWWHPNYPHFDIRFPWESREREEDLDEPVLDRDFFALQTSRQSAPSL